jgi:hypothetical protein
LVLFTRAVGFPIVPPNKDKYPPPNGRQAGFYAQAQQRNGWTAELAASDLLFRS